jgi:hypothetical protein
MRTPSGVSKGLIQPAPRRIPQAQIDKNAGEPDGLGSAGRDRRAAHADEDLLVGLNVARSDVPVTHGHAHFVSDMRDSATWATRPGFLCHNASR